MNKKEVTSQLYKNAHIDVYNERPRLSHLRIEIINYCNFQCPLCLHTLDETKEPRSLTLNEIKTIVAPVISEIEEVTLHGPRGEPFLNPEAAEIIEWLKLNTKAKVSLSTNGSLLTEKTIRTLVEAKLDRLIFAIDGLDQDTYEEYRVGGDLNLVLANMKALAEQKKKVSSKFPTIVFQFLPMSLNEHQIDEVKEFALARGADKVRLRYPQSIWSSNQFRPRNHQKPSPTLEQIEDQSRCPFGLDSLAIDSKGNCYPCSYSEGTHEAMLGNALSESLTSIWDHSFLWKIRESFALQNHLEMCLRHCSKRLRNNKLNL